MSGEQRPERAAGIDYGRTRIGLAIADELGILAHPRPFVPARPPQRALRQIAAFGRQEAVTVWVVGLPLNMDGSEGSSVRRVRQFAAQLEQATRLPVQFEDERLSTVEAQLRLREAGGRSSDFKNRIDSAAAAVLLQSWLDSQESR